MVAVTIGDTIYLLDCPFDESLDDYPPDFEVYELPLELEEQLRDPGYAWDQLPAMGSRVGRIPINMVEFDASRRQSITTSFLDRLER